MGRRNTLFVGGLSFQTRARDVAREFERFGKLVRCDIPTPGGRSRGYAFVEFEDERDAEDAYKSMKYARIDGREVSVQWSRKSPTISRRSRSPRRSSRRSSSRSRSRSRDHHKESKRKRRSRSRSKSPKRGRSKSPKRGRSRSPSPKRKKKSRSKTRSKTRSKSRSKSRSSSPRSAKQDSESPGTDNSEKKKT